MRRERIADDIYVFISDRYAQVTMGIVATEAGAIAIDTLPFPEETRQVLDFVEAKFKQSVRYVINTHHHADHIYGTYLFEEAQVIAHHDCREALIRLGPQSLRRAKQENPELAEVEILLPDMTFGHELYVHLGQRTLHLMHAPGHTDDSVIVMVEGDKILFAGDLIMPVPYIVWGNRERFIESLRFVQKLRPESVVQGHGDILLRGELRQDLRESIRYLNTIYERVRDVVERGEPQSALREIDIESCGKSRIPLDGLVKQLHQANLAFLYRSLVAERNRRA